VATDVDAAAAGVGRTALGQVTSPAVSSASATRGVDHRRARTERGKGTRIRPSVAGHEAAASNAGRLVRVSPEPRWPDHFTAMRRGDGCPMCAPGDDETPHGVRVFAGAWADGYLGRYPVRPGYAYVIWKGRHVAEPWELSAEESAGFWAEVGRVAKAVEDRYQPAKMNWLSLGNGVPHLHVHLVPRPRDDARAGWPLESEAFHVEATTPLEQGELEAEAAALRSDLEG
jgi:diadenosine tetraphosphate (Ap4A) HIT family hydrolase